MLIAEAIVPPLTPPLNWNAQRTSLVPWPSVLRMCSTTNHAPMSEGTESTPQKGTMRVPSLAA